MLKTAFSICNLVHGNVQTSARAECAHTEENHRLNTRRSVRGRGTDRQGTSNHNTNMFHLGTRMPSMAPRDLEQWDMVSHDHRRLEKSLIMAV